MNRLNWIQCTETNVFYTSHKVRQLWPDVRIITCLSFLLSFFYILPLFAQNQQVIRVGAYDNPPKIAINASGKVSGFWPDLLSFIAKNEGWQIQYLPATWDRCFDSLKSGSIDVMPDVAYTEKRAKEFIFSGIPILMSWTRLYIRADHQDIHDLTDLNGKKIAALLNAVNLEGSDGLREIMRSFDLKIQIIEVENIEEVFKAIEAGRVDGGIVNRNFGNKFAKNFAVKATSIIFQPINMQFAFPKVSEKTPILLEKINRQIKTLKTNNNSEYYRLLNKYFETGIAEKKIEVLPDWFMPALGIGAGIILFLGLVMFSAKIQIKRQTREIRIQNEALAAEKERLAVTLNSIGDGVIATDRAGIVVMINKVAVQLTGWERADAMGKHLLEVFKIIDEQSGKPRLDPVTKVLSGGAIIALENHTVLVARDGTNRNIADSAAPIFNKDSQIIGVILVFRDVTEKKRNRAAMLKIKKLESVGVLAGGIAHDFNNILTAVIGNIDLARMMIDSNNEAYTLLMAAKKASTRAIGLTQQLLTFSKGGDPIKTTTSIAKIIRDSANFVLHGSAVSCTFNIPDDLWLVDIDAGQIGQVIQNLVINAKHAMPDGGTIHIDCSNVSDNKSETGIKLPDHRFIKIAVSDTGSGITEKYLEKIFDPYFTTKQEGSGLGLAVSHSIILKHNGRITVQSVRDKGTTFTIYLPASENQTKAEQANKIKNEPMAPLRILLMDDDDLVRSIAKDMLTHLGHEVLLAVDGREAVDIFKKQYQVNKPVDITITDLTVPGGMGGKQAIKEILKTDPRAKVIVSSGYSNDPVMSRYREFGFCAAITKPFIVADLTKVLSKLFFDACA